MKHKTILVVLLALSAAALSVVLTSVHTVQAQTAGGAVQGDVLWTDQYGDAHSMPWAQVTANSPTEPAVVTYTTSDGTFGMWLPSGTWDITVSSSPGFYPQTISSVVVTSGSSTSLEFTLQPTGAPIPELPPWVQPLVLVSAVLVTAITVRRYRPRSRA